MIDAAYRVFIKGTAETEELKSYIYELQTKAKMYLEPARIRDYLQIIFEKDGIQVCQQVMEYVVLVLAQFLQIMVTCPKSQLYNSLIVSWKDVYVDKSILKTSFGLQVHYNISKKNVTSVTAQFDEFNANFEQLKTVFQEVTGKAFVPGRKFSVSEQVLEFHGTIMYLSRNEGSNSWTSDGAWDLWGHPIEVAQNEEVHFWHHLIGLSGGFCNTLCAGHQVSITWLAVRCSIFVQVSKL